MKYLKKTWQLLDNYMIARWQNRPSTAAFWYLPEPANITSSHDLIEYQKGAPFYPINYKEKLNYSLENADGIIVLPYEKIGHQINPEAAFQYTLALHDESYVHHQTIYQKKFWQYVDYFVNAQTPEGLWPYQFNWFTARSPWYSALAQSRGAAVMLRAWLISKEEKYLTAAKNALTRFNLQTEQGGFLHIFKPKQCPYFEEYPNMPTGVINGFMASLISIWELKFWLKEVWIEHLWSVGMQSLEEMLPYYSNGWWSLYDLDPASPILNVNSPRYHLLEINYLHILSILSGSSLLRLEWEKRLEQYQHQWSRYKAYILKMTRKILYR